MNNLRNKVQLIGRLGANPELKKTSSGKSLAKISVATKEIYKNQKGEKVVETQWHNCIAWGSTAERMEVFLKKGNEVALNGKLVHNSYQTNSGETRYQTQVVINEFMLLSKSNTANNAAVATTA
ncbi:MAG: single-stranded DNA-binding protein [Bacteroidota bacterium]